MQFTDLAKLKIYQPLSILLISITAASVYFLYATWRFSDDKIFNQYYYVVPIVVPFTIFLLDRAERIHRRKLAQMLIDSAVVIMAMWRVIGDVPYVSGHTLFLTYCILTVSSLGGRITAIIVLIEVIYLKLFVWNDWITSLVGIVLGIIAALIEKRYKTD
jgi:hypothetical protein